MSVNTDMGTMSENNVGTFSLPVGIHNWFQNMSFLSDPSPIIGNDSLRNV